MRLYVEAIHLALSKTENVSDRLVFKPQTERMGSAKSYVLADGIGAASSPHTGISALPYWQLGVLLRVICLPMALALPVRSTRASRHSRIGSSV